MGQPLEFFPTIAGEQLVTTDIQSMKKLKLVISTPLKDFQVEREKRKIHKSYAYAFLTQFLSYTGFLFV